ncbi:MAG: hypothetical protein AB7T27_09040 [Kiritimatiellia bacterium]
MTRKSHIAKTQGQRQAYNRYIQQLDYEPTVDEALRFANSTQPGEELTEPTSKRKRSLNTGERFRDHIIQNWLNWVVGVVAVVLLWLMYDSKIDFARMSATMENQKESLDKVEQAEGKNADKNTEQDLLIGEHKIRIGSLERKAEEIDARIKPARR